MVNEYQLPVWFFKTYRGMWKITTMDPNKPVRRRITPRLAWCMFDWANSAFRIVIVTFVFGTYFATSVASNSVEGASLWGSALAFSGVIIATFGPLWGQSLIEWCGARYGSRLFRLFALSQLVVFVLFALSGKITSFLGPAVMALVTLSFDSHRAGMACYINFSWLG